MLQIANKPPGVRLTADERRQRREAGVAAKLARGDLATAMYRAGRSIAEIAAHFGVAQGTARSYVDPAALAAAAEIKQRQAKRRAWRRRMASLARRQRRFPARWQGYYGGRVSRIVDCGLQIDTPPAELLETGPGLSRWEAQDAKLQMLRDRARRKYGTLAVAIAAAPK